MSLTTVASSSTSASHRGADREIAPRALDLELHDDTPRYWLDGDPYKTNLMNAFSVTFPEGEKFFIAAVRHFREKAKDPRLVKQVKGFLAQESLHRREHEQFNEWLAKRGHDIEKYEAEVIKMLEPDGRMSIAMLRLAITCALEHFTALMADLWLTRDDLREQAHPDVRALWTWHALEELDHKAVAFDVYKAAGGSYALRALTMIGTTVGFFAKVSHIHVRMMKKDRELTNVKSWARGIWQCWGPNGYFSSLIPAYLQYFKPSFHPWDKDDSELVKRFERELGFNLEQALAS